ncbi:MAG: polyketide synthase pks16 [Alectoria fallacina]|uniref:Polyketide synthase pks16 n=1 Tax=Alectoria fallacina TaxID=1903189 RepID=A0A8H3FEH9_9LECA|nr:MAG: polyketide synthase pks16 [Alectoria fallacina]
MNPSTGDSTAGFSRILETIASKVGIEISELTEDAKISDLGVDSLLTISISSRLRPETGLDLPSSLFISYPTVAQLRGFFLDKVTTPQSVADDEDSETSSRTAVSSPGSSASRESLESVATTAAEPDLVAILISIITLEVGIDATEIQPSTLFADLGVDSLLTISILDSFKSEARMSLAATFFHENSTLTDVEKALGVSSEPQKSPSTPPGFLEMNIGPSKQSLRSKSVLLQGRPSLNRPALFLLPDGAGSLFSYISLPTLLSGVAVYGFDSPFHNSPKDYTLSFEEVASIFIKEIRAIQPRGPYMLGGWSLGGIHAYEASRQLIAQGETVTNLIMIDSPCPGTLPPLPSPTLNLLEKAGIFDGLSASSGPITERTRLHFLGSVRALENYTVKPITYRSRSKQSNGDLGLRWGC